jgi:hypothetical protein
MKKNLMSSLILLLISITSFGSTMDGNDSTLVKKYWNSILPVAINSKSGVLYRGINNNVELKFSGNNALPYKFILTTNNGSITTENNKYITYPKYVGFAYFSVYLINHNNDTLLIGKKRFNVVSIPEPCLKIGSTIIHDRSIVNRKTFLSNDSLKLFFTDDLPESNRWYTIDYFNAGYTYGGTFFFEDNPGPIVKTNSVQMFEKQLSGQEMIIKVVSVTPTPIHFKTLPIIRFKLL